MYLTTGTRRALPVHLGRGGGDGCRVVVSAVEAAYDLCERLHALLREELTCDPGHDRALERGVLSDSDRRLIGLLRTLAPPGGRVLDIGTSLSENGALAGKCRLPAR